MIGLPHLQTVRLFQVDLINCTSYVFRARCRGLKQTRICIQHSSGLTKSSMTQGITCAPNELNGDTQHAEQRDQLSDAQVVTMLNKAPPTTSRSPKAAPARG